MVSGAVMTPCLSSTTSMDSLVVQYVVCDGSSGSAARNHDAFLCTLTRTDSPAPSDVLSAVSSKSSRRRSSRSHPTQPVASATAASRASALVRGDQIFLARGLLAVDRDLLDLQRAGKRDLFRVGACERGLDLGRNPLAQLLGGLGPDLLHEGGEQPAADAPGHAEGTVELGRPAVEPAVDVYLLVRGRSVAAVFLRGPVQRGLHRGEDLSRELPAADRVERDRGAGGGERLDQIVHEGRRARVAHVRGAE